MEFDIPSNAHSLKADDFWKEAVIIKIIVFHEL